MIRLLSPFFHPEQISTGRYNTHLVRALVERGHAVEVVCSEPLYPGWRPRPSTAALPGVTIRRGGGWMRYPRPAVLRRLALELWFAGHAVRHARGVEGDRLVAVFPPDLGPWLAMAVAKNRVEKVGIVHDLQGIMAVSVESPARRWIARCIRLIERRALRACDRIVCLSESMREVLVADYGIEDGRCRVCYPFVTLPARPPAEDRLRPLFAEGRRHVVYAGALGEKQRPDDLLALFRALLRHDPSIHCHVFSAGPQMAALRAEVGREGPPGLFCHDLVPDDQLVHLYAHSTIQVIPQAPGTGAGAFPSKLPNLLALGVPVFALCDEDSELARVLAEAGAGRASGALGPEAWPRLVSELITEAEAEGRAARRQRLAGFIEAHFSVDRVIEAIVGNKAEERGKRKEERGKKNSE